jgi:methylglyoxal synthase
MSKKHNLSTNIGFLVSSKNALRIRQFLETHQGELAPFTIIATLTEGKELEAISGLKIQYVPSLESGGCSELAHRVKKYLTNFPSFLTR